MFDINNIMGNKSSSLLGNLDILGTHKKESKKVTRARQIVMNANRVNQPRGKIYPYHANIERDTIRNNNWRKTPFTGKSSQVVLMSINPGDNIENEIHPHVDQFFRVESGHAKFIIDNGKKVYRGGNGTAVMVPQGHWHKVCNDSKTQKLKLYTIYSPSNHPQGTLQRTHPRND